MNFSKYWPLMALGLIGSTATFQLLTTGGSQAVWSGFAGVSVALLASAAIAFIWKRSEKPILSMGLILGVAGFVICGAIGSLGNPVSMAVLGGGVCLACLAGVVQIAILPHAQAVETKSTETPSALDERLSEFVNVNPSRVVDSLEMMESVGDEEVSQSWSRFALANGDERFEGMISLRFEEGEQLKHFHIPVSPPFKHAPTAHCEVSDDGFRATFTQLQPYGARLTLKRRVSQVEAETVEVEIVLMANQQQEIAA